jgi:hypothetical protein
MEDKHSSQSKNKKETCVHCVPSVDRARGAGGECHSPRNPIDIAVAPLTDRA